jgi:hypothetical protein
VNVREASKGAICGAVCVGLILLPASSGAARKRPELKVTSLDGLPAAVAPGSEFEVRDTVRNKGRRAKRTTNRYFLSENRVRESADVKLEGSRKVPRLKRREKSTETVELGIPRDTTRGAYRLIVCADAARKVREKRESNNCRASSDRIEVGSGGGGDGGAPPRPVITGTDPPPPSSDSTPQVFGVAEPGTRIRIYAGADCSGDTLEAGSAAAFNGPAGIGVRVPEDRVSHLRATATDDAGNVSRCSDDFPYTEDSTPPATPSISGPSSPSGDETPAVVGDAAAGSTVRIYAGACPGTPVALNTAGVFGSTGIMVTVPADAATTLFATATDVAGNASGCSAPFTYTEDSTAPGTPAITGTAPASPADDTMPEVIGTAEAGSIVSIYDNAACEGAALGTGAATTFAAPGVTVTVGDGTTTALHAHAVDAAGNTSACSAAATYEEVATP